MSNPLNEQFPVFDRVLGGCECRFGGLYAFVYKIDGRAGWGLQFAHIESERVAMKIAEMVLMHGFRNAVFEGRQEEAQAMFDKGLSPRAPATPVKRVEGKVEE